MHRARLAFKTAIVIFAGAMLLASTGASGKEVTGSNGSGSGNGGDSAFQYAKEMSNSQNTHPVIEPFKKLFDVCVGKADPSLSGPCQFENMGVMPSKEHLAKSPGSCHNIGKAIDVGKINCGAVAMRDPQKDHEFYRNLATCFLEDQEFGGQGKFQQVIYGFGSEQQLSKGGKLVIKDDHKDHLHIQWDCNYGDGA